ncbi:AMP-binding protein [Candidatus Sulfidibacterium hydrothermale]|uniref:AMP-binding protein n=1 Tax=Candidatus Sulfidibacterium hydrothermale TaxID=2875962 RepID=UPI001F0A737A|nr:AMP-binding protein [Candidatus Sulfidibacterium hydrothermale]UBM63125.1 AMP-binding protein [Candidatus Sulfidibacterium hydrothermale]
MTREKKILRLNTRAFDEAWHLQYAYTHLKENWSPAPWKKELMYFIIDWLSDTETITVQTSGSTGTPKKIRVDKKAMKASARMTLDFFDLKPGDKILLCLPVRYIAAKMMVVRAFTGQLDLYCIEPKLYPYSEWTPELHFAAMTPAQAEKLLETEEGTAFLNRIEKLLLGGSGLSLLLEEKLQTLQTKVWHSYGMTETLTHVALRKVNGPDKTTGFQPLPGVSLSQTPNGCLQITAPHIGVFDLETHDVVEFLPDGSFRMLGRTDNVINSGGVKLFPEQIEQKLSTRIQKPFYIGKQPDRLLGERPVLFIESEPWPENSILQLKKQMQEILKKIEIPDNIVFKTKFERTASGKIIR